MENKVDLTILNQYVDKKLLSVQKHPTADLLIYNYTHKCQFDRAWDDITMMCRGLIVTPDGTVVARPFKKFFNLEEHGAIQMPVLPKEPPIVLEKMDGSLGITYWIGDEPYLATRGSFTSSQAIEGTRMLQEWLASGHTLNPGLTYLFEIIYPENRIVVNYGSKRRLVLLGVTDPRTGAELNIWKDMDDYLHFDRPQAHVFGLQPETQDNSEGYVFWWPDQGIRAKMKFAEYVRLHRLITGVNKRRIWEMLRANQGLEELLDRVPDEFYAWVRQMHVELETEYQRVECQAYEALAAVEGLPDRKDQAAALRNHPYRTLVFNLIDKKQIEDKIWLLIKPKAEIPYKVIDMGDA